MYTEREREIRDAAYIYEGKVHGFGSVFSYPIGNQRIGSLRLLDLAGQEHSQLPYPL